MSAAVTSEATEVAGEHDTGEVSGVTDAGALGMVRATKLTGIAVRGDGIAVVTVNDPRESVNTVTRQLGEELTALVERIEADAAIKGVVLASAKKDFIVGANIDMLKAVRLASDAEAMARGMAQMLAKVAAMDNRSSRRCTARRSAAGSRSRSRATRSW